jgi:hypothetical protein
VKSGLLPEDEVASANIGEHRDRAQNSSASYLDHADDIPIQTPLQGYYREAFEMNDARQVVTTIDRLHMDSGGNNYDAPNNQ